MAANAPTIIEGAPMRSSVASTSKYKSGGGALSIATLKLRQQLPGDLGVGQVGIAPAGDGY